VSERTISKVAGKSGDREETLRRWLAEDEALPPSRTAITGRRGWWNVRTSKNGAKNSRILQPQRSLRSVA
jgi:hypothetical protein